MGGAEESDGCSGSCIPSSSQHPGTACGQRGREHSHGTVFLALNGALKVTEEGRALAWGFGSRSAWARMVREA